MYNLRHLGNNIFLLEFDQQYDLAMHFLRIQEYYESDNPEFRNKHFDIWDCIEWHSKNNEDIFIYAYKWGGFNVPGEVMSEFYSTYLPYQNKYDKFMHDVFKFIISRTNQDPKFYLIGARIGYDEIVEHEMAHALWNLNSEYKQKQLNNLRNLDKKILNKLHSNLKKMKYSDSVIDDEIQAYLSTGLVKEFSEGINKDKLKKISKPFQTAYKNFTKKINN